MTEWNGPIIPFGDLRIQTDDRVYGPDDDTFLLEKHAVMDPDERVLEMGCGTGFVSISCALKGAWVTAADVNPLAVELTRHNAELNDCEVQVRRADLFEGVGGPFDVILFNPPYLPTSEDDHVEGLVDRAFDGGPAGDEIILRFIQGLHNVLAPAGKAVMVVSSLTDRSRVDPAISRGYRREVIGAADAGMERLEVWGITREGLGSVEE